MKKVAIKNVLNFEVFLFRNYIMNLVVFLTISNFGMSDGLAKSFKVSSVEEFENAEKKLVSGDSIIWKEGIFSDINIKLWVDNVFFISAFPGATTFKGSSTLEVPGNGNTISGFQFVGGNIEGDVIDISGNNNRIEHINIKSYDAHYYLRVRPNCQYNVVSYCNFESKPETQESSVVQIEATDGLPGYHKVSHCSFKNHTAPAGAGGDFGIEALRIGYSYQRTFISRTIVEYSYFEKCNGDYEVISNKACENIIRYNTFMNNGPAHLTLRHGSRTMVYGNFFIKGAGVRIKEGQNHAVINNYFDTGEHMAISIQNHHFDPVDTVVISHNTFVRCSPLKLGGKGDYPPGNISLANNLFSKSVMPLIVDPTHSEIWGVNVVQKGNKVSKDKIISAVCDFRENEFGFYEVEFANKALDNFVPVELQIFEIPELDDDAEIEFDIMKQKRKAAISAFPGCYLPSQNVSLMSYATENNAGPIYLR